MYKDCPPVGGPPRRVLKGEFDIAEQSRFRVIEPTIGEAPATREE